MEQNNKGQRKKERERETRQREIRKTSNDIIAGNGRVLKAYISIKEKARFQLVKPGAQLSIVK